MCYRNVKEMVSDESGESVSESESEFYYPEQETLNQMMPINCDRSFDYLFPHFKKKTS